MTFICGGSEALLKIGTKSFQADVVSTVLNRKLLENIHIDLKYFQQTQSQAEHTIIASNHYHQANISCTSEGKNETFVDFYVVCK